MARSTKNDVEDLAARMSAAEDQAFQEFAQIFGPRLRAFLISRGLTVSDAEDLAISCVTDISLRIEKYRPQAEGGFEAWVFTLARHFLADWWRQHKVTEPLPDNLEAPGSFEEKAEPNESIISAVRQAVAQLSETDRLIVRLRYLEEERSFAEIGEFLGIHEGTARVRLSRALKHLEPVLKKDHRISDFLKRRAG